MPKLHKETYGLDSVAIEPRYSTSTSCNLTVKYDIFKGIPIFASDSTMTGTMEMAEKFNDMGMWSFLSTQHDVTDLYNFFFDGDKNAVPTFGVSETQKHKWNELKGSLPAGKIKYVNLIHHNTHSIEYLYEVGNFKDENPDIHIFAGSVSDPYVAARLTEVGASIVKIGFDYRHVEFNYNTAGVGVGHASALLDCVPAIHDRGGLAMGAGFYNDSADVCKAFALGSDLVQLEETLLGHDECYGKTLIDDGETKKNGVSYRGEVTNHLNETLASVSEAVTFAGFSELQNLKDAKVVLIK